MDGQPGPAAAPGGRRLSDRWFAAVVALVAAAIGSPLAGFGVEVVKDVARTQPCIVGTWNLTSSNESMSDDSGEFDFQLEGGSAEATFASDGTLSDDMAGTTEKAVHITDPQFVGKDVKITTELLQHGTWSISGNVVTFKIDVVSGHSDFYVNGTKTSAPFRDNETTAARFTCSSATLTLSDISGRKVYSRPSGLVTSVSVSVGAVAFVVVAVVTWLLVRRARRRTQVPPPIPATQPGSRSA